MPSPIQAVLFALHPVVQHVPSRAANVPGPVLTGLLLVTAAWIVSLPMLVVHECGHLIAGRLVGVRIIEFNIGVGPVCWERTIRGVKVVLRCVPVRGHVKHLKRESTSRFAQMAFIAGGPAANLLVAGGVSWWSGTGLAGFFSQPSCAAVVIAANLYLGVRALIPVANRNGNAAAPGSDGWQLLRLLRGKPTLLDPEEISRSQRAVGLRPLRRHALLLKHVCGWLLVAVAGGIGVASMPVRYLVDVPVGHSSLAILAYCVVGTLAITVLFVLGFGIRLLRKPWTEFASFAAQRKFSPLRQRALLYQHTLAYQAERWRIVDLPEDDRLKLVSTLSDPTQLPWLEELCEAWPQVSFINLLVFDALMSARRYGDAAQVITATLVRDDLPEILRFHWETCLLSAQLGSSADDATIAACQAAIDAVTDEGMKMWRLIDLASTIPSARHSQRLDLAATWCGQAREIYPYDVAVQVLAAFVRLEQGDAAAARTELAAARKAAAGTNQAVQVQAWLALAAALEQDPKAADLLRRSLRQQLPYQLKQRLEEALRKLTEPSPAPAES